MQDKEIIERVREDFISLLRLPFEAPSSTAKVVDKILSHKNIAVIDPDAEFPDKVMVKFKCKPELTMATQSELGDTALMAYQQAQRDMRKAGWVKGIKNE